jgi:hypothetical protein
VGQERLSVRKIRDLLRLHLVGGVSSRRQLGRAVGCSKTAVTDCLRRAAVAGLNGWEMIAELDEAELERRLYPSARDGGAPPRTVQRPLPDWAKVREELARSRLSAGPPPACARSVSSSAAATGDPRVSSVQPAPRACLQAWAAARSGACARRQGGAHVLGPRYAERGPLAMSRNPLGVRADNVGIDLPKSLMALLPYGTAVASVRSPVAGRFGDR